MTESLCELNHATCDGALKSTFHVKRLWVLLQPWHRQPLVLQAYRERDSAVEKRYTLGGSGRIVGPLADIQLPRSWLRQCEDLHGEECHSPRWLGSVTQPSFLRVIDVKRECIVSAPADCRYLALSYVWGDRSRSIISTKHNIGQIRTELGMGKMDLPRTIAGSMTLVSALGERYLWVDALCIVQDDEEDPAMQVENMDSIYAGALLTTIAAADESATQKEAEALVKKE